MTVRCMVRYQCADIHVCRKDRLDVVNRTTYMVSVHHNMYFGGVARIFDLLKTTKTIFSAVRSHSIVFQEKKGGKCPLCPPQASLRRGKGVYGLKCVVHKDTKAIASLLGTHTHVHVSLCILYIVSTVERNTPTYMQLSISCRMFVKQVAKNLSSPHPHIELFCSAVCDPCTGYAHRYQASYHVHMF